MAPQQHFVISWVLSNLNFGSRKERIVTTICGVIPDVDGLGILIDKILGDGSYSYYFLLHRKFGHGILGLTVIAICVYFICKRRILPVLVAILIYTIHLFFDLIGSAGPYREIWPLYPLWPFSNRQITVGWQWGLNSWQNTAITAIFIVIVIVIAIKKRRTFLEVFSRKIDQYCISLFERIIRRKGS